MDWKNVRVDRCPVASALERFGDRWSMLVIRDLMNGVRRFDELVARLGVSRATLSDRLDRLVESGLIRPADYTDSRGRVRSEYRLTPAGWDLLHMVTALREWGDRHVIGEGAEPFRLVERTSGHVVRLALIDTETGEVVDPRRVELAPGPGMAPARPAPPKHRSTPLDTVTHENEVSSP